MHTINQSIVQMQLLNKVCVIALELGNVSFFQIIYRGRTGVVVSVWTW